MTSIPDGSGVPEVAPAPVAEPRHPIASVIHTLSVIVVMAAWAYLGQRRVAGMRAQAAPNHPLLYLRTMAFEWAMVAYIVYGIRKRGVTFREIVGPRWKSASAFGLDVLIAIGFWITSLIVLVVVSHLVHAPSTVDKIKFMIPHGPMEIVMWIALSLTAGICEEIMFRGYLQTQFAAWTRNTTIGIVLSAAAFGGAHIYQGGRQTIVLGTFGALFGILAVMRRSLKPGMIAHFLQDSTAGIAAQYVIKNKIGVF